MKHIAEQFEFPFFKKFYIGDKVVVTPDSDDGFKQFYGVVQATYNDARTLEVTSMDGEQYFEGEVDAHQCRLATTLDLL